jgi:L-alanine-DL-glutamate epimerase-like enolase superfamily enzyme
VTLRLDVNGAWPLDRAPGYLEALARQGLPIAYVEQPVPPGDLPALTDPALPIAADESLALPGVAERLLERSDVAVFVVKPTRLGLRRARALAVAAQHAGRDVTVTHAFEGPVGLRLCCELALSLPRAPLACGLLPHPSRLPALWADLPHLRMGLPPVVAALGSGARA